MRFKKKEEDIRPTKLNIVNLFLFIYFRQCVRFIQFLFITIMYKNIFIEFAFIQIVLIISGLVPNLNKNCRY